MTHEGLIYICRRDPESVKIRNLRHNERVSLALETAEKPMHEGIHA